MSVNITIAEGGRSYAFTAKKLKIALQGGGKQLYVPESEVQLGTKTVYKNGEYSASADGKYGFSSFTASISDSGSVTGKGQDDKDYMVTVDSAGDLVETELPESIEVITPPYNPYVIYRDGQTITKDGMVVKAYCAGGEEFGTVQNNEITINPTQAVYDPSTDTSDIYTDNNGIVARRETLEYGVVSAHGIKLDRPTQTSVIFYTLYDGKVYIAAPNTGTYRMAIVDSGTGTVVLATQVNIVQANTFKYWFDGYEQAIEITSPPESSVDPVEKSTENLIPEAAGSHQTIAVSWPRPGDGKVLETTFDVIVQQNYGGATGGGGQTSGGGAGRND